MLSTLQPSRKHSRSSDEMDIAKTPKFFFPRGLPLYRYYQSEANDAICNTLQTNSKCLVKMFCGTGKSLVMAKCDIHQTSTLSLFVFPSLALIDQFYNEYLLKLGCSPYSILRVSSEDEQQESDGIKSTTDPARIASFLTNTSITETKRICVTYQSYETLVQVMDQCSVVAGVAMYDEAHRAIGKTYQNNIFHLGEDPHVRKQIFFTATPKNANDIVMHDPTNPELSMCGPLAYDYNYFKALTEGYLNHFDIRVDFSAEEGNHNYYKSIARAILATGNNRVLTFHKDVTTGRDLSVINFSNREAFLAAFEEVCRTEFPDKVGFYSLGKIRLAILIGGKGKDRTSPAERAAILKRLDDTPDNEIYIVSSCRTIGEGIDTKRANMCVFVDPKTAYVDIIQNVGRILRKPEGKDTVSTVLLLCRVDRAKYEAVQDDPIARDAAFRHDVQDERGDFNAILNVLSALKQESPELHEACLHYPNRFSPKEIDHNLDRQGYKIIDNPDGDGGLLPNLEYVLDTRINSELYDDCEDDEELIQSVAENNDVCVEIHSDSLEEPVKKFNTGCDSGEVVRLFCKERTEDEVEDEEDWTDSATYQPIVKKSTTTASHPQKRSSREDGELKAPNKKNRVNLNYHGDNDIMVLWRVCGNALSDCISRAIEPEVVDNWAEFLEGVKTFINETGKRPNSYSCDPFEHKQGTWLCAQTTKYNNGKMQGSRTGKWEFFREQYKVYLPNDEEKWRTMLDAVRTYIDETQNRPPDSTHHGAWITFQMKRYKNGTMSAKRISEWEAFYEVYKEFVNKDEKWSSMLKTVERFIHDTGRKPISRSQDETKMAKWIIRHDQRYKNGKMMASRIKEWEGLYHKYPQHFSDDEEIWDSMLDLTQKFMDNNTKRPSAYTKEKEERQMGQWVSNQVQFFRKEEMSQIRATKWKRFCERNIELLIGNEEKWERNLSWVYAFINRTDSRPNSGSTDRTERSKGMWVNRQHLHYINGTMDGSRIRNWQTLCDTYKNLFKITPNSASATSVPTPKPPIFVAPRTTSASSTTISTTPTPKEPKKRSPKKKSMEIAPASPTPTSSTHPVPPPRELTEEERQHRHERNKSQLEVYHQKYKSMRSDNLHDLFKQKPKLFHDYHACADANEATYSDTSELPVNRIIAELEKNKHTRTKIVLDLGCGRVPKIRDHFAGSSLYEVRSFDHVAAREGVEECDIAHLPLQDNSVDIGVLSLAMWGSNYKEYLQEAYRVLDTMGWLYIGEATRKWCYQEGDGAARLKDMLQECGFTIREQSIKKFSVFTCVK